MPKQLKEKKKAEPKEPKEPKEKKDPVPKKQGPEEVKTPPKRLLLEDLEDQSGSGSDELEVKPQKKVKKEQATARGRSSLDVNSIGLLDLLANEAAAPAPAKPPPVVIDSDSDSVESAPQQAEEIYHKIHVWFARFAQFLN